ncbi:MAG: hypothetical protein AABX14_03375 [Candidatus Aenigmatarchaeota archaeon]
MSVRINPSVSLSGADPEYPLVLSYESGDLESPRPQLTFSLRYKIRIDGDCPYRIISGVVEQAGMSSRDCLDDEDATELMLDAERESVGEVTKYLKELFSGAILSGSVRGTSWTLRSQERVYRIGKARYTIEAVEEVHDAFDEFEHYNFRPDVTVEADSTDEAIAIGGRLHQEAVERERREGGFMGSGSFYAIVTRVLKNGQVVFEQEPPEHAL